MKITDDCLSCMACTDACENNAIYDAGASYIYNGVRHQALSEDHTYIAPELCTSCKNCWEMCTFDAIVEA